jgi:hypothetical protein
MDTNYDIFKRLQNGRPLWITAVPGIEEARVRVDRLEAIAPWRVFNLLAEQGDYRRIRKRLGPLVTRIHDPFLLRNRPSPRHMPVMLSFCVS